MYKAVVFDFDGTIIDTEKHLFEIINKHLIQHNSEEISLDFYRQSIGGAATELHRYLEEQLGKNNKEKVYLEHNETSVTLPIVDAMHQLMEYCKKRHIPMAIATSSYREDIQPTFDSLGLDEYIEVIVGREDVEAIKPNPDPYLTAVQRLNYNPANCLAIEDSVNGATAAITAGLDVIVNTNDMTELQDFSQIAYTGKDLSADEIIALCFEADRS
ncbi:HAD-IA family hydrolase [Staphylococcus xylosus]|uniref:HAD family hydrolase n=1 Tax=Staphylococcus xylosus TaxID=1288 RepID=A0A5R9B043_STAXY|nr:HAD-IA family hydrolase [Staphylococcus xylosus]AID42051.1 phosphoglycolate phosphatase [Staphylococcus xylosus]MEB6298968.1 HAD-IA family hydrolase [Staphylococcus xylosus]MEB6321488.1 HAD-IA family hydrolase [Staphylococcus xylosus]MEB7756831.1 HAD-IA family hydrolase [Staphylococcus xylosus]MEB7798472.1 HAD-IA family hydrolase [Staphylococcus xylosus]